MIELYQKILVGALLGLALYLFFRKKDDKFSKEYLELVNSDKYKVKGPY